MDDRTLLRQVRDTLAQIETTLTAPTIRVDPSSLGDREHTPEVRWHRRTGSYAGRPLVRDQVAGLLRDHPDRAWRVRDFETHLGRSKATLTNALGSLAADGVVRRTTDGTWQLADVPEQAAA